MIKKSEILSAINNMEIVDELLDNIKPHEKDTIACYDVENNCIIGMNIDKHKKVESAFIEIARMDKDVDFECICDECNEDCANYNWKQNNEEPPMPHIVEECIWNDTYDNLYDLYIANDDIIDTRIQNYYKNLEQLKR